MKAADKRRAARARQLLDESIEHLDGATLSKLNQARQRALEAASPDTKSATKRAWYRRAVPAGGFLAAALAAMLWWPDATEELPGPGVDDFEILVSADSLEMLEDLEFFMWLEEADVDADAG